MISREYSDEMFKRMRGSDLYRVAGDTFAEAFERSLALQDELNSLPATDTEAIAAKAAELFGQFGQGSEIRPPVYCDYGAHTFIGAGTYVNFDCVFLDVADITIGQNCLLGPRVQLLTAEHPLQITPRKEGWESGRPIAIRDNVWLGAGVMVLPGVTIGENTVVGAGAVVTRDLPANVIAVGNPARVIRELPEDVRIEEIIPDHLR